MENQTPENNEEQPEMTEQPEVETKVDVEGNAEAEPAKVVPAPEEYTPVKIPRVKKGFFARFRRESKRDRQIAALTTGYQELTGLMSSIRDNLELQTQGQEQLLKALSHLPEAAEGLRKMGEAAEQQTNMMGMMRDQLDSSAQHDQQLVDSMNRFNKTLVSINRMAGVRIFFAMLLAVAVVGAVVYFSLSDSGKQSLDHSMSGLFDKVPVAEEAVTPGVEPPEEVVAKERPPVDEPVVDVEEPIVDVEEPIVEEVEPPVVAPEETPAIDESVLPEDVPEEDPAEKPADYESDPDVPQSV